MRLRLNPHSGEPIWRQIVEQIKFEVAAARLPSGAQLPSIRGLADELSVNPRTVVKAYEKLESLGLVLMKHGQGVFVANRTVDANAAARKRVLSDLCRRLLAEASRLGARTEEVIEILRQTARSMERTEPATAEQSKGQR